MQINENTKIIARLHKKPNARGLNIYNPYFEEVGENVIYLLFYNEDPKVLLEGVKNLNIAGGIAAGFESDPRLFDLMDELGPVAQRIGRVGTVVNKNGKFYGENQGGYGLLESIRSKIKITGKKIVILGAGNVVKALLTRMELDDEKPGPIEIYNRTVAHAEQVAGKYKLVSKVGSIQDMEKSSGDIFINATDIGSVFNEEEDYKFSEELIERFDFITDVTFQPLKPQLIQIAEKLEKPNSPGYRMFIYQGKHSLEMILSTKVVPAILEKHVMEGLSS